MRGLFAGPTGTYSPPLAKAGFPQHEVHTMEVIQKNQANLEELIILNAKAKAACAEAYRRMGRRYPHLGRRIVQIIGVGKSMYRLKDATTGQVLGFRQTYIEACGYARELERGAA